MIPIGCGFVLEVTVRRVRGHADLARDLAQTEGLYADLLDENQARIDQGVSEVAVVVGRF